MLRFTAVDYEAIRRHAEKTYPHECCGILLGTFGSDARTVQRTIRCQNIEGISPSTRYEIDTHELLRAQREAREQGLEIVGFYHSHPDHSARCSPTDLEQAHWIGCSYVIISVENGKSVETRSFALTGSREEDKALVEEEIAAEAGSPAEV